jgi:excisionase family DNA binding protein
MKAFALTDTETSTARPPDDRDIMSVPQACDFLDVHRNTLYKLINEGEIPAFRLTTGGRWKFRRRELEEWLEDRQARRTR